MSADWTERRQTLLQKLQMIGSAGRAEGEPLDRLPRGFYPVADHLRMLDPEVVLVVGARGSGKTEIARILTSANMAEDIIAYAPAVGALNKGEWLKGYPLEREGFDAAGLTRFLAGTQDSDRHARDLWFTYLIRVVDDQLDEDAKKHLERLLGLQGGDIDRNLETFQQARNEPLLALDRLDARLEKEKRFLFITYDELDTLGGGDWKVMETSIRGLIAFWAAYARRWSSLRAKIFLRTDLYERHAVVGGADLAKLAANRVELSWSDRDLYAMLLKRIANADSDLLEYLKVPKSKVEWKKHEKLGEIPELTSWQDARPIVERMIGPYMGANKKKGLVYRWLLDHMRDGRGRALPRPLVRLVEEAARVEMQGLTPLREPKLMKPTSLRSAVERVSEEHVVHARDEWPWLDAVKEVLKGQLVPWDRERDVVKLLDRIPETGEGSKRPPFDGQELLDYLVEVGILRRRADGRIDASDLFLHGLGLKRKGGVRRR